MSGAAANVLVVIETRDGACDELACGAVAAGRRIARARGVELVAAVFGCNPGSAVDCVALGGADRVVVADHDALAKYTLAAYRAAVLAAIQAYRAEVVVMAASPAAWDLAPRLAVALDAAFVSEVSEIAVEAQRIVCTRGAFGGKLEARLLCDCARVVLSVDGSAFDVDTSELPAPVEALSSHWLESVSHIGARRVGGRQASRGDVDLSRCEVIVAGGRGVGDADRFRDLIVPLAEALGAGLGASRPVVDAGWVDRAHQVGSSGQAVQPRVYIACGISGAAQHLAGMRGAGYVIAINKDRRAPIFATADLAVVGDLVEVVPALTDAVRARKV